MNMFDEARAIKGTMELCHLTQREMAEQLGISQSYVANKIRLLNFSPEMQRKITESGISERHARALLRLSDEHLQESILKSVAERSLTVRECEALVGAQVDAEAPSLIGRADELERIEVFRRTLRSSIDTLRSFGIGVSERHGYYGEKLYITVCIEGA